MGTAIAKVFNLTVASTGLNEKTLKNNNIPYQSLIVVKANHATYYPYASSNVFKLLYDKESGKILGAQGIGVEGVDKRIDVPFV